MILYYTIEKYDKNGLVSSTRKRRARSFIKAFIYMLANRFTGSGYATENTGGSPTSMFYQNYYRMFTTPAQSNLQSQGIVVGSSSSAVQSTQYCLQALMANGSAASQLQYGPHISDQAVTVAAPSASFSISRIFRNKSGGDVTVREIGFYVVSNNYTQWHCLVRDTVSPMVVSDSQYIKVTYTFQITAGA